MDDLHRFAKLVGIACHDLRTPLATVYGFTRTLERSELDATSASYVEMIGLASMQLQELLEELALVARITSGRFDPALRPIDTLTLVREAAAGQENGSVTVEGTGALLESEPELLRRALTQLIRAALRHGGVNEATVRVDGVLLEIAPTTTSSAPVLLGEELRELGAAAAVALIKALGGSLSGEGDRLLVRLA